MIKEVLCPSCGHLFKVRIPDQAPQGAGRIIQYKCPHCGKQLSEHTEARKGRRSSELTYVVMTVLIVLAIAFVILRLSGQELTINRSFMNSQNIIMLLSRIFVLLICFPVHECAHAWTADKLGDPTGRNMGRISLNPLRHLDLWGTITIFLFGFGYAKPVPVNINNFRNKKRDFAITALAGPISNLLMALLILMIARFVPSPAYEFCVYASYINVSLAVFNIIPIPPLDGSRVLTAFLPDRLYYKVMSFERYSMIILFVALMFFNRIGYSPISDLSGRVFNGLFSLVMR